MTDTLLTGVAVLLVSVVILSIASAITINVSAALARRSFAGGGFVQSVAVLMVVVLVGLSGIILQVGIWAGVLNTLDQFHNFRDAFYCSANNFTSLGLDRMEIQGRWRLLGPLEAMNGALMFGVTTAMVFTIMTRLSSLRAARIAREIHDGAHPAEVKPPDDPGSSPPTIGSRSWFL